MDQSWFSIFSAVSIGNHRFRDLINQDRLNGLAAIVIGMSQLPMAFMFADATRFDISLWVIGVSGMLLIAIGVNVFRGMEAFEIAWSESKRVSWLDTIIRCMFAVRRWCRTVLIA